MAIIKHVNVVKHVTKHLSNPNYSLTHRRLVGGSIAIIGFTLIHFGEGFAVVHYFSEFIGMSLHAVGAVPFLSSIEHAVESEV
jgi:hypothetical protein